MNTYDVWFTREGPVGSGDHRCLHVLESSRDQALEALRGERVRAVNVEFLGQTGWDRSVYLTGRSREVPKVLTTKVPKVGKVSVH